LGSVVNGEGILQDILAIDRRSRHPRAVAMKAWPQRLQTILEFVRVHVSKPTALFALWAPMSMRILVRDGQAPPWTRTKPALGADMAATLSGFR
jgi:hypothetical protein